MINKLITLAKENNIDIEILTDECKEYEIEILNKKLQKFDINKELTYQIKAIYNGKMVVLDVENISNPDEIINTIINNANLLDNDNQNRLCDNDYKFSKDTSIKFDINRIKNELLELDDFRNKYPNIVNIESGFSYIEDKCSIDNSNHHMDDMYAYMRVGFFISAKKGDINKSVYFSIYDNKFDIVRIKDELEKYIKELELSLDATSIKTNKYNIILNNNVVYSILGSFTDAFYEKSIAMKLSPLTDKVGKKIFSDKITIVEEPLNDKFIVNEHFDSEGVLTYNKTIVDKGVFKLPLNTLEYSIKNNTKPTGNAGGTSNMYIVPGDKSYNELVKELDNGIIISECHSLHAGINYQTGDISLQSDGFLVENGKIVRALDMIILQTNFFDIFSNVIRVGNDLKEFSRAGSGVSLLLENITISGNID